MYAFISKNRCFYIKLAFRYPCFMTVAIGNIKKYVNYNKLLYIKVSWRNKNAEIVISCYISVYR